MLKTSRYFSLKLLAGLMAVVLVAGPVVADGQREADGSVTVGIRTAAIDRVFSPQRRSQWCWAACIQMLLAHNGVAVSQEAIVRRSYGQDPYGRLPDWPGSLETITRNLNYQGVDERGRRHQVRSQVVFRAPAPSILIQELANDQPVIIGYRHPTGAHAVLVTAANYVQTPNGPMIRSLTVRDPFPSRGSPRNGVRLYAGADLASRIMAHWFVRVQAAGEGDQEEAPAPGPDDQSQADRARLAQLQQQLQQARAAQRQHMQTSLQAQAAAANHYAQAQRAEIAFRQTGDPRYRQLALQHQAAGRQAELAARQHAESARQAGALAQRIAAEIARLTR